MEKGQELFLKYSTLDPLFLIQRPDNFFKASPPFHLKGTAHLGIPVREQTPSKSWLSVLCGNALETHEGTWADKQLSHIQPNKEKLVYISNSVQMQHF